MKEKIAIIGGTLRERIIAENMKREHPPTVLYAIEGMNHMEAASLEQCLKGASALILPVLSNDERGKIFAPNCKKELFITPENLKELKKNAVIYCGIASDYLRDTAKQTGHPLKEIMELDEVAIPNGVLTAEGALSLAMLHFPIALRELYVAVLGFGRVGKACAKIFQAAGAKVTVFCRSSEDLSHGRYLGYDMRFYSGAAAVLPKVNCMLNTVPVAVIDEALARHMQRDAFILDLASAPGGVAPEVKEKYDFEIVTAPGLPGKYAPLTAGKILSDFYISKLPSMIGGEGQ